MVSVSRKGEGIVQGLFDGGFSLTEVGSPTVLSVNAGDSPAGCGVDEGWRDGQNAMRWQGWPDRMSRMRGIARGE